MSGCGVYSFTGASVSPDIKTISIKYFTNLAQLAPPTLSQVFTEAMKDKFISQTNLTMVERNGDLNFEGTITGYSTSPIAIQGNETAAKNRLTITVNVKFTNQKDEKMNFETTFTRYSDFDSNAILSSVETVLIKDINTQLVQDIFNKAIINW